ncbi:MAG: T9SS type B sorting domain-containing protein [Bacteroidales bacterium]
MLSLLSGRASSQADNNPPAPPVLDLITVQPGSGKPELTWSKSPSADVAGYVLYYYTNGEGHAFDTIHDPNVTSYINLGSEAQYWIESYVVAALDTAGNISPLSNELQTIFPQVQADSCTRTINLSWNSYVSYPKVVTGYTIQVSEDGGPYSDAGHVGAGTISFPFWGIKPAVNYCFIVTADLEGGFSSSSVIKCTQVQMERGPDWINADYATIDDNNNISISFTIDPLTEINTFRISRKSLSDNDSVSLTNAPPVNNNVIYSDQTAKATERYLYWLLAINNCGIPSETSNVAGNIVLELSDEGYILKLRWNSYTSWNGGISDYRIYMNTGSGFELKTVLSPGDTVSNIDYHDLMNMVSDTSLCFYVEANEVTNQYGITGKSRSNTVCMPGIEKITVPNAFTPDNDNLNDLFRPVLSFTPSEYQLIITDRQNNKLFETSDPLQSWDGTKGGSVLPRDVYLWFLRVKTPSGKIISKTGTISIVKTR